MATVTDISPRTSFRVKRKTDRPEIVIPDIIVEHGPDVDVDGVDCTHTPHHEDTWEQTYKFRAKGYLPGDVMLEVGASFAGGGGEQAKAIKGLFDVAIVDDDKAEWTAFLRDTDAPDIKELGEVADWLLEQYGDRPTKQSSASSDG